MTSVRTRLMAVYHTLKERLLQQDPLLPKLYDGDSVSIDKCLSYLSTFEGGQVDLEKLSSGIAVVTLNQPNRRNAITGKMMYDLYNVVGELEKWKEGKAVILKGMDDNFCSGGDLSFAKSSGTPELGYLLSTIMDHTLSRFECLPLITVALLQGCGAIGGGAELSVACDYRLASSKSQGIGFVHGRMGVLPAWRGAGRLVKIVGYRKALDILSTAKMYKPEHALQIGLIDEIIQGDKDELECAKEWLSERTALSSELIKAMKVTLHLISKNEDSEINDLERRIFAPFWGSPGQQAAIAAAIKQKAR